jgi:L-2-hydroxyglutarate oxidase
MRPSRLPTGTGHPRPEATRVRISRDGRASPIGQQRWDLCVVGAGIVGLASARAVLRRHPGWRVLVLDKEPRIAAHQSGHNSGVIHAGIYYTPGSLKARLCVAGSAAMLRFCEERGIAHARCGKVIVATDHEELPRLHALLERGRANGVPGLELIGPERLRELEPHVRGIAAIWSPNTGIADYPGVCRAYADDILAAGGEVRTGAEVLAVRHRAGVQHVQSTAGDVEAKLLLACTGLHADRMAAMAGAPADLRIVPFRGDYYLIRPERDQLVRALIYPVPDPRFPFLGVHFTRKTDGRVWCGPNAVLAFAREGYRFEDLNLDDVGDALAFPGFRRLARRYWRTGLAEMYRDLSRRAFLGALRRYIPELTDADLLPGPAGVRAQALDRQGRLVDDFSIHRAGRAIHVRNAPSPAATSSLMIGEYVADVVDQAS